MSFLSNVDTRLGTSATSLSSTQLGVDAFQANFSAQASNGNTLTAMTAASSAFSLGRTLGGSMLSQVLGGSLLRAGAWAGGFVSEVLVFRGANQILTPGSESWYSATGIASTATDFLMMKGAGVFCGTSSYGVRQFVQASAMVGGEYAGESMGVRERSGQAFSGRFAHALATGVALEAGGILTRRATAASLETAQRNLAHQASVLEQGRRSERIGSSPLEAMRSMASTSYPDISADRILEIVNSQTLLQFAGIYPAFFSAEYLSAMIRGVNGGGNAAAVENIEAAVTVLAKNSPHLFNSGHVSEILGNSRSPDFVSRTISALLEGRFLSRGQTAEISKHFRARSPELMREAFDRFLASRIDIFTGEHVPAMMARATNPDNINLLVTFFIANPHLLTRAILLDMVHKAKTQRIFLRPVYKLARAHSGIFISEDVPDLIQRAVRGERAAVVVLSELAADRPALFTREHLDAMVAANVRNNTSPVVVTTADLHEDVRLEHSRTVEENMSGPVASLLALNRKLFTSHHVDGIIASVSQQSGKAAELLAMLVKWETPLFRRRHVPLLIRKAREHRQAAEALDALMHSRGDLFTDSQRRETLELLASRRSLVA